MTQRYASKTKVSVERSEVQLKELLRKYGADAIATFEDSRRMTAAVGFRMRGRNVRLTMPLPDPKAKEFTHIKPYQPRTTKAAHERWDQACRARWRLLLMTVQIKLEAIEAEVSTFDREFLADIMLPTGQTFHDAVAAGNVNDLLGGADDVPLLGP